MTTSCPHCSHSILSHRNGQCLAIVTLPYVYQGERAKGHCGCNAIQPPNSQAQQMALEHLFPDVERVRNTQILKRRS